MPVAAAPWKGRHVPFLLRVELPDVPGSLGRVAAAIGEAGGDIEAIEIVEHRADGMAVDDVLLETAPGVMPDSVVSACNELQGVTVLWISRYAAGGQLFLDLEAVEEMTADPAGALDRLVDLLPMTYRADWAVRVHREKGVIHATHSAPDSLDGDLAAMSWPELSLAGRLTLPDAYKDYEAAAAPIGDDELVAWARYGGPDILDSEIARFRHLAALAVSINRQA